MTLQEAMMMGSTLYNKIYLGRSPLFGSRRVQLALALGLAAASAGIGWFALRSTR
ncbi:hypothetical protein [Massilia niastensis]|uniref:hypothetical protein n=1 Tax=Massilia niastensis TaxID=544911 RepID=UPI0003A9ED77|nr:hypothetical protein [Massilia niastensis]